jgi:hypothetical protein
MNVSLVSSDNHGNECINGDWGRFNPISTECDDKKNMSKVNFVVVPLLLLQQLF